MYELPIGFLEFWSKGIKIKNASKPKIHTNLHNKNTTDLLVVVNFTFLS